MLCLSFTPSSKLLIRLQRESERATKKRRWKRAKAERKENGNKTIWQKQSWSFTSTDFFKLNKTIERVRKKERDQKCETEAKEGDAVSWIPGRVRPLANHDPSLTDPRAFPRGHCVYTSRRWWKGRSNKLPKWRRKFTEKCPFRDNPPPHGGHHGNDAVVVCVSVSQHTQHSQLFWYQRAFIEHVAVVSFPFPHALRTYMCSAHCGRALFVQTKLRGRIYVGKDQAGEEQDKHQETPSVLGLGDCRTFSVTNTV